MKILLLCLFAAAVAATEPGAELQVNQRGIDRFVALGVQLVEEEIKKAKIPDVSGKSGILHYELKNIEIKSFSINSVGIHLHPSDLVELDASGVAFNIEGHYKVSVGSGWLKVSKSGELTAETHGAKLAVSIGVTTAADGHPALHQGACSVDLGDFEITFHGGIIDKIIDLFKKIISKHLKDHIPVCKEVENAVVNKGNPQLAKIPLDVGFTGKAKGFHIDYHLTSNPVVTDTIIAIPFLGKFWFEGHQNDAGIPKANGVIHTVGTNEMICLNFDADELFGSAAYAFKYSPLSKIELDKNLLDHLPAAVRDFFKCFCTDGKCIGAIIPEIQKHCPASGSVTLDAQATALAGFHFNASGAYITASLTAHLKSETPDNVVSEDLFDVLAEVGILLESKLRIEGWTIKDTVELTEAKLSLGSTYIGDINIGAIEQIWNLALKLIIDDAVNEIVENGIPLPALPDATLINPRFVFGNHVLILCSDVDAHLPS